jgi:glycosyltransferase involved in cell wall biosynthesis
LIDISVIIPTFNRRYELPTALDSVFAQTGVTIECILIDDGSSDDTIEYVQKRYSDKPLVIIEKDIRSGPQVSRNLGIVAARGEFITFLDSDDFFEPNTLADRVMLCRKEGLNALFSGYRVKFVGRRWDLVKNVSSKSRSCPTDYAEALRKFKIAPMITIIYRRSAHEDLKLDESLVSGHDDDLSLQLIRAGRFAFDDILSATIIQHIGERVATPRNLMIGDAQLLQKYTYDIIQHYSSGYLTRRRANALAGLLSVGQFRRLSMLSPLNQKHCSMAVVIFYCVLYLPLRLLGTLCKQAKMALVRVLL